MEQEREERIDKYSEQGYKHKVTVNLFAHNNTLHAVYDATKHGIGRGGGHSSTMTVVGGGDGKDALPFL
jgi:hypothetical protein